MGKMKLELHTKGWTGIRKAQRGNESKYSGACVNKGWDAGMSMIYTEETEPTCLEHRCMLRHKEKQLGKLSGARSLIDCYGSGRY